jgi:hypothetical protein
MEFNEEIDFGADVMTVPEFYEGVRTCCFSDYDGFGYASNGKMVNRNEQVMPSDVGAWKLRLPEYSHVVWYNK